MFTSVPAKGTKEYEEYMDANNKKLQEFFEKCFADNITGSLSIELKMPIQDGALHLTAEYGRPDLFDFLVNAHGLDPKEKDNIGKTALHYAIIGGHRNMVDHLVKNHRLDPKENACKMPFLAQAIICENLDMIDHLVNEYKFDPKTEVNYSVLELASTSKETFDHLVTKHGLDPKAEDPRIPLKKILHHVAFHGDLNMFDHLVTKYKLDPKEKNNFDQTALHAAVMSGNTNMFDHLVTKYKLDPKEKNNLDQTTLHFAAISGNTNMFDHLVTKYELDPNDEDYSGQSPLNLAINNKCVNIILWAFRNHYKIDTLSVLHRLLIGPPPNITSQEREELFDHILSKIEDGSKHKIMSESLKSKANGFRNSWVVALANHWASSEHKDDLLRASKICTSIMSDPNFCLEHKKSCEETLKNIKEKSTSKSHCTTANKTSTNEESFFATTKKTPQEKTPQVNQESSTTMSNSLKNT